MLATRRLRFFISAEKTENAEAQRKRKNGPKGQKSAMRERAEGESALQPETGSGKEQLRRKKRRSRPIRSRSRRRNRECIRRIATK
jgi:hypothetical protein